MTNLLPGSDFTIGKYQLAVQEESESKDSMTRSEEMLSSSYSLSLVGMCIQYRTHGKKGGILHNRFTFLLGCYNIW